MALKLRAAAAASIAAHGEASYPDECVGLLLGRIEGDERVALEAYAVENRWAGQMQLSEHDNPDSRRDRFYLDPRDYLRADKAARERGLDVVGCYHSHPDWPAEPSERDRVGSQAIAGPYFAFAIQSVRGGKAAELRSWTLAADGSRFTEEDVAVEG
jgi:proteasome lid subunit RPN8/RPN11